MRTYLLKLLDLFDGSEKLPEPGDIRDSEPLSGKELRDFFQRLLTHDRRVEILRKLVESGAAKTVLPELDAMKGVHQPREFHPEGDCLEHTILTVKNLRNREFGLSLAALLHDVGKPGTFSETDRIRFHGHEGLSAKMAAEICRRMEIDESTAARVEELVARHMQIKDVGRMNRKSLAKFVRDPLFDDLLELARADCLASHGDLSLVELAGKMAAEIGPEPPPPPPPLITGEDLISLGYKPGPAFSKMLSRIEQLRSEGIISNREEALETIRKEFPIT